MIRTQKPYSDKESGMDFFLHTPVMLEQLCNLASTIKPMTLYVDCTIGAGGHAEALLKKYEGSFVALASTQIQMLAIVLPSDLSRLQIGF